MRSSGECESVRLLRLLRLLIGCFMISSICLDRPGDRIIILIHTLITSHCFKFMGVCDHGQNEKLLACQKDKGS